MAREQGDWDKQSCGREGELGQRARGAQTEGGSVSRDLEAGVCALENSKSPCWAGRFRHNKEEQSKIRQ